MLAKSVIAVFRSGMNSQREQNCSTNIKFDRQRKCFVSSSGTGTTLVKYPNSPYLYTDNTRQTGKQNRLKFNRTDTTL